jgi:TctA family transporter
MLSGGSFLPMVTRPVSLLFLAASISMLLWPWYLEQRRRRT